MVKINLPDPVGKCPFCTINLYMIDGIKQPAIFPCGVRREEIWKNEKNQKKDPFQCPWESVEDQKELEKVLPYELVAGLLGTMHGNE
jgi:hypothetical protein